MELAYYYIYHFWYLFCQTFDTVSCVFDKVGDLIWSILILHYKTIMSAVEFLVELCYNITYILSVTSEIIMCVVHGVLEFVIEVLNCLSSLLTFLWRLAVLCYHIVSVIVSGFENLVSLMWTGSIGTMTMMSTSIELLKKSWNSTWHKGETFINKLFLLIIGGFETIGSVFIEIIVASFNCLLYSFLSIPRVIIYTCDYCIYFITYTVHRWQEKFYSVSKESFLGLSMCILLLAMFFNSVQIMTFLDSQGMTFPFFRSRQTRERNNQNSQQHHHHFRNNNNNGFEARQGEGGGVAGGAAGGGYHFEFSDNEFMEEEENEEVVIDNNNINHNDHQDDDDDDDWIRTFNNNRINNNNRPNRSSSVAGGASDTESVSSDSSELLSSSEEEDDGETSESEIDIQLPSTSNRSNPGSRSSTPVPTKSMMNSNDVEKELERERDKRKCVVCQDRMKTVLILPCRHMCLCVHCAEQIVQLSSVYRRLCPLCRVKIEKVMNVYV